MGSKEFRKLQSKWYQTLEKEGFKDIEKESYHSINREAELTRFHSQDFKTRYTPKAFDEKKKYFEKAKELLDKDIFINGVERRIWALHSLGVSIRKIVEIIGGEGNERNKNEVNALINEFQELMFK